MQSEYCKKKCRNKYCEAVKVKDDRHADKMGGTKNKNQKKKKLKFFRRNVTQAESVESSSKFKSMQ